MLLTLIRKELLSHLRTLRLIVALLFTVVLCALTTLMGSLDFSVSMRAYEGAVSQMRADLDEARLMDDVGPHVIVAPQPLTVLARGVLEGAAQRFQVRILPYWMSTQLIGSGSYDDLMLILVRTDLTTVVALVLSFLAIVLGFDAVCGEREHGTLKLLLSHPVPRVYLLAAKLIGGALALWLPLALAFALSLLILQANPDVAFSGDDWLRLGIMFALSCLILLLVYAVSVMVSTLTRSPATSLIICLFGWLVCGVGYANALPALMRYGLAYPPFQQYLDKDREAEQRMVADIAAWEERHPSPPEIELGRIADGPWRYATEAGHAWLAKKAAFDFERLMKRADEDYTIRWPNQRPLAEQEFAVDRWSILSPLTNYRTLCKWVARSTLDDRFLVARYGIQYRRTLMQWMRARLQATDWRRWYTDDPPDQESLVDALGLQGRPEGENSAQAEQIRAWVVAQNERAQTDPRRHLDLTGMPMPGEGSRRSLSASLREMMPGLSVMLLSLALAMAIAVRRFSRYPLN